ncbi:MAG: glycosyltransferase [Chlorobi bacterium]|nr:glycosyltransferase [Chlorobiota bacterium]
MHFTLVSTIFNESQRLQQTISDIESQSLKPTEIVITDAGSTDGSIEILKKWQSESTIPIKILIEKGCNVAKGRNLAIKEGKHEIIVSTDFGCRFHSDWLKSIVEPFEKDSNIKVIGGAYTVNEAELATKAAKANYILTNGYKINLDENFIPSSRSIAYYKNVWKNIGGYPEWLTLAADDLVFGLKIKANNIPIKLINKPYVFWGRHASNKQYNKEAYRYGLGDGEAKVNYKNFWSNLIETLLRYLFFVSLLTFLGLTLFKYFSGSTILYPIIASLTLSLISIPGLRSYIRTYKNWKRIKSSKYNFKTFLFSLLMLEQQRLNYIKGYIKGYWFSEPKVKSEAHKLKQLLLHEH